MATPQTPVVTNGLAICCCLLLGIHGLAFFVMQVVADRAQSERYVFLGNAFRMDAANYLRITENGYQYNAYQRSSVAFFPFYPQLCRLLAKADVCSAKCIMIIVANLFFFFSLMALVRLYSEQSRSTSAPQHTAQWSLILTAFMPTTFFFHLAYAESMFCFFTTMVLLGIHRRWPLWVLALFAGAATGTRPVGLAIAITVLWYAFITLKRFPSPQFSLAESGKLASNRFFSLENPWMKGVSAIGFLLLSCWGLLAYMAYLWWAFDAPLGFAKTQEHWTFHAPRYFTYWDKVWSLLSLEPIWNVYNPHSQRYWLNGDTQTNPFFSLLFWNPIFYVFTWLLLAIGWWKKWLKDYEIVLSIGLLLIPYITRGYEMSMASHARFAAVVIPQYFVLGRLFVMLPTAVAVCLCGVMISMLVLWTILFVAGYQFF